MLTNTSNPLRAEDIRQQEHNEHRGPACLPGAEGQQRTGTRSAARRVPAPSPGPAPPPHLSVPSSSLSPRITTHTREPMQRSISSEGRIWEGLLARFCFLGAIILPPAAACRCCWRASAGDGGGSAAPAAAQAPPGESLQAAGGAAAAAAVGGSGRAQRARATAAVSAHHRSCANAFASPIALVAGQGAASNGVGRSAARAALA